jgi:AraC family transcriptional regulator of adaptative response/methylated-DNA-[protein]-cysteine methyltransferase
MISWSTHITPFGTMLVASSERGVCQLFLGEDRHALERVLRDCEQRPLADTTTITHRRWVAAILASIDVGREADVPLDLGGARFQNAVWDALRAIPRGETRTYLAIAKQLGDANAVRAVGSACGQNPVSIVVPCHRALRSDGGLGGYRWGLPRKRAILDREARDAKTTLL